MALEGSNLLDTLDLVGGVGTGRLDRGSAPAETGVVVQDPVSGAEIATHALYGAATPSVGSAYALPRNHCLYAPMDFEVRAMAEESAEEREARMAKFEPPEVEKPQLTADEIREVRKKNLEYYEAKKKATTKSRVEFIESRAWDGEKKGYYFGTHLEGVGYKLDYVQMRLLMALDVADRCEARYGVMKRYFHGVVTAVHDDDCSYDVRFEHGHLERRIPCEDVNKKHWIGKVKEHQGIARSLMAANPLLEEKDAAVKWYEQLLTYERGLTDQEPAPPDAVFFGSDDASRKKKTGDDERAMLALGPDRVEPDTLVESGEIWNPESTAYRKVWDSEGRPLRYGPPESADWYGGTDRAPDGDVFGDGTLLKRTLSKQEENGSLGTTEPIKKNAVKLDAVRYQILLKHMDNSIAETSYDEDKPRLDVLFCDEALGGVPKAKRYIQGIHEGLASMRPGDRAVFVLTPEKAFGRKGRYPAVPGYSKEKPRGCWMQVELELVEVIPNGAEHYLNDDRCREEIRKKLADPTAIVVRHPAYSLLARPSQGYDWDGRDDESTDPLAKEGRCDYCLKPKRAMHGGKKFLRCGKCKVARYCQSKCAQLHWKDGHRDECAPPEDHDALAVYALFAQENKETGKGLLLGPPQDDENDDQKKETQDGVLVDPKTKNDALARALVPRVRACYRDRTPRVAVVVAYRNQLPLQDRQAQLFKFVPYMVAFMGYAEPKCEFVVVVATQTDDGRKFNRGRLMNAAFHDVVLPGDFDSVIFHDVDLLPSEDLMPFYAVPPKKTRPLHLGAAWRTKFRDRNFTGGVLAMRPADFVAANGYPNDCWGWGLDDREFALRAKAAKLRVLKPPADVGSYVDLDPINMRNIVFSEERGYYHEYWNMDMENGKCHPKIFGPIAWDTGKYGKRDYWTKSGLADIDDHAQLVARTEEFSGRVIRLLYALESEHERKLSTVALISGREGLKLAYGNDLLSGPVAAAAMAQTHQLALQGNLAHKAQPHRIPLNNPKLLSPEDRYRLQGGKKPLSLTRDSPEAANGPSALVLPKDRPRRKLATVVK